MKPFQTAVARFALLVAAVVSLARPGAVHADPSHSAPPPPVCASPVAAQDVEVVIYGAEWCGACAMLEHALSAAGVSDQLPLGGAYARARVTIRHVDVDRASPAELAELQGDGIPEIHVTVRRTLVEWHEGAYADAAGLRRFVEGALSAARCRLSP